VTLFEPAPAPPALADLNDEQREAVTHGDGPLLIVAGAGTGKTQVITRRIAWLIGTRRARPDQILALTFTDKAAAEMEARVDRLVPMGFVGATISTFHAFCDRLVREHAVELGLTSQLRVEQPAEILVFLRERLFELGLDRYLPLGRPDEHLAALVHVFDRARDEDVSPAEYAEFAARLHEEAGDDPERLDRAEAEIEKARAYAAYQKLLFEHGRVDFGSQISLALRLLRERPYLAREYRERFRYVLVDEFQDTNHVQFELVKRLAGAADREGAPRNLTAVGDDDQSIYRFRGAKVENLLGFIDAFPGTRVVLLRQNYRSGQRILDLAHRMIQHNNPERLEARDPVRFGKRLTAARGLGGAVEQRSFASASDEADAVAAEIAAAIEAGRRHRDFAILARAHRQLDAFALALRARGLRFQRGSTRGLYARPEVMLCLNLLRLLADPEDGAAAYGVLSHALFGVDPVELARLAALSRRGNRGLLRVAAAAASVSDEELSPASREAIRRFLTLHARLADSTTRRPTTEVLYEFVTESGLLGQLSAEDTPEAAEQVQNLNKLFGIVQRVGPLLKSDRVPFFIRHLDLLIEAGDDPQAAVVDIEEDAVQLLTAHNAKGLEFDVVYMVQLVEQKFPLTMRPDALGFPAELSHAISDPRTDHEREERRLFYVGMTRARERLMLCHADDYGGRRTRKLSRFVIEALELPAAPKTVKTASAAENIARFAPAADAPAPEFLPLEDDQTLELSHGQIDDYLTCPLKYRYAHIVQIPLARDPQTMYGILMHHAIRIFLQHRMKGLPIGAEDVVAEFDRGWSGEGFHSEEHEQRRLEQGRAALRRFVSSEERSRRVPLAVEMEFKFKQGANLVRGRWDRIDEVSSEIVLVDYKTAEIEDLEKAEKRANEDLRGGQLGLYALAYFETRRVLPARVQLHFVDSGTVGEAAVDAEDLDRARERIDQAAAGIRLANFPPKPDQRNCGYCPYSRFCIYSAARGGA
jgi:DNA helicase II / ATP-dependent DNA helicase PcrA